MHLDTRYYHFCMEQENNVLRLPDDLYEYLYSSSGVHRETMRYATASESGKPGKSFLFSTCAC